MRKKFKVQSFDYTQDCPEQVEGQSAKCKVENDFRFSLLSRAQPYGRAFRSERGQTLIEALAAVAIAVIIITSLVTLGIATQRAASTSRNQNQNTRYGEETLELIRSIRDAKLAGSVRNGTTTLPYGCNSSSSCSFADLYTSPYVGVAPFYFTLSSALVPGGCTAGGSPVDCYQLSKVTTGATALIGSTIYTRTIKIWDSGVLIDPDPEDKVKFVEVIITWTDQGGTHTSDTTTKLTNFK